MKYVSRGLNVYIVNPPAPVGAKGCVFPEALATGGGATYYAGKTHGTFIKHRNLQHVGAQTGWGKFWT